MHPDIACNLLFHIIHSKSHYILISNLELSIHSDPEHAQFSRDGVIVLLEWTLLHSQTYYQQFLRNVSINADPPPNNLMFAGSMRVWLVPSYNTAYNVSATQHSTCQRLIRTAFLELNYSK